MKHLNFTIDMPLTICFSFNECIYIKQTKSETWQRTMVSQIKHMLVLNIIVTLWANEEQIWTEKFFDSEQCSNCRAEKCIQRQRGACTYNFEHFPYESKLSQANTETAPTRNFKPGYWQGHAAFG